MGMLRPILLAAAAVALMAATVAPGLAQSAHDNVRKALVHLSVTGKMGEGSPFPGQNVTKEGTGFLISTDGLVLTTYHLIESLGPTIDGKTIKIAGSPVRKRATPEFEDLPIVNAIPFLDLLLLKLPTPPFEDPYRHLQLGSAVGLGVGEEVLTSGFPRSSDYHADQGRMTNRGGPRGHIWTVGIPFEESQSGSPIYDDDGTVLGIVKGSDPTGQRGYFVPIQFADPLVAHLRLSELSGQVGEMEAMLETIPREFDDRLSEMQDRIEAVRRQRTWSGQFSENGADVLIRYNKLVAGPPHVTEIACQLKYTLGQLIDRDMTNVPAAPRSKGGDESAFGEFRFPNLGNRLQRFKLDQNDGLYEKIECHFRPTLDDGTVGAKQTITLAAPGLTQ